MKTIIFTITLLLTSLQVNAGSCASWGCKSIVTKLYTTASGPVYIGTAYDEKLANCTPVSEVYFTLNMATNNAKEIYASVLAAYSTGKEIGLRVIEGTSNCEISYVTLD